MFNNTIVILVIASDIFIYLFVDIPAGSSNVSSNSAVHIVVVSTVLVVMTTSVLGTITS